jgi:hypothetical protein
MVNLVMLSQLKRKCHKAYLLQLYLSKSNNYNYYCLINIKDVPTKEQEEKSESIQSSYS